MKSISINASWVYGYRADELGESKYDSETRKSTFHWRGQSHVSAWMAANDLRSELWLLKERLVIKGENFNPDRTYEVGVKNYGGEQIIGVEFEAEIDRLNCEPDSVVLDKVAHTIIAALKKVGFEFEDIEMPNLYFMVDFDNS